MEHFCFFSLLIFHSLVMYAVLVAYTPLICPLSDNPKTTSLRVDDCGILSSLFSSPFPHRMDIDSKTKSSSFPCTTELSLTAACTNQPCFLLDLSLWISSPTEYDPPLPRKIVRLSPLESPLLFSCYPSPLPSEATNFSLAKL